MKRSSIQEHPQNPRFIDDASKRRLRNIIKEHGLVEPLVVNKRTGRLLGGHQRLSILDGMERGNDYELTVALIDVDEKAEKTLLIALNNPSAQGSWDVGLLEQLLSTDVNFEDAGFTIEDLQMLDVDMQALKNTENEPDEVREAVSELEAMHQKASIVNRAQREASRGEEEVEEKNIDYRALRNEQQAKMREEASSLNYLTIYFDNPNEAIEFRNLFGIVTEQETVSGKLIIAALAELGIEFVVDDEDGEDEE